MVATQTSQSRATAYISKAPLPATPPIIHPAAQSPRTINDLTIDEFKKGIYEWTAKQVLALVKDTPSACKKLTEFSIHLTTVDMMKLLTPNAVVNQERAIALLTHKTPAEIKELLEILHSKLGRLKVVRNLTDAQAFGLRQGVKGRLLEFVNDNLPVVQRKRLDAANTPCPAEWLSIPIQPALGRDAQPMPYAASVSITPPPAAPESRVASRQADIQAQPPRVPLMNPLPAGAPTVSVNTTRMHASFLEAWMDFSEGDVWVMAEANHHMSELSPSLPEENRRKKFHEYAAQAKSDYARLAGKQNNGIKRSAATEDGPAQRRNGGPTAASNRG